MLTVLLTLVLAQEPMRILESLQRQVDTLQARLDGPGELYMRATVDYVAPGSPGTIVVGGWAFAKGEADGARLVLMIDGVQSGQALPENFYRWDRPDVSAAYAGFCAAAGAQAGFQTVASLTSFEPGRQGDAWHEIRVRVYDRLGRKTDSAARRYNSVTGVFE